MQWEVVREAILERLEAVELFLADLSGRFRYESQLDVSDPANNVIKLSRQHLTKALPSFQKRIWLASMDLVCDTSGQFWFVDDHFCCPYGLYRMQRAINKQPDGSAATEQWNRFLNSGRQLLSTEDKGTAVVLGPATYNTVYSENRFLAECMGLPYVSQRHLNLTRRGLERTSHGLSVPVNTVFRRLQDGDLDPNCFQTKSLQGVRGLVRAARRGKVAVLNAPGTGMFNDRSVSKLIPSLIRFYLGREPRIPTIPTQNCEPQYTAGSKNHSGFVFRTGNSMDLLKPLVGNDSTDEMRCRYFGKVEQNREGFVVRQTVASLTGNRHEAAFGVRAFCIGTSERTVLTGGLKRECHCDGTPIGPVTQDATAEPFIVTTIQ